MPDVYSSGDLLPPSARLMFQIEGAGRASVTLPLAERIVVGRSDEDSQTRPELDLAPYGGEGRGVSRTHAVFIHRDHAVYIEDLGSTNGTRINGLALTPNQEYRVRDGDELEFGSARLTVRFTR